jgi:spore maturation protein CgeB
MKLLAICSNIDLSIAGGGVPVCWQLLKGFHETGTEVVLVTDLGKSFSSPWWRTYERPFVENKSFDFALTNGLTLNKKFAGYLYYRGWKKKMDRIFSTEKDIDGVLLVGAPHLAKKVPSWIRKRYQVPTVYYETDIQNLPKYSLDHQPEKHKFPDYSECDAVVCSFEKISQEFRENGLQNVRTVPFGADPAIFSPMPEIKKDIDVFFSGFGELDREDLMQNMITEPSIALKNLKFVVEGSFGIDLGNSQRIPSVSLDRYLHLCCGSEINLNILRRQFVTAGVLNSRAFELASLGCCIVTNPCEGLNEFFEPNKEMVVVNDAKDAIEKYKWLLSSKDLRTTIGNAARQRVLKEHTYANRAHQIMTIIRKLNV